MAIGVRAAAVRRSGWASTLRSRQRLLADFGNIALRPDPAIEAVNPYICRTATQAQKGRDQRGGRCAENSQMADNTAVAMTFATS